MGLFKELGSNVTEIGVMAVTIVLISILLNNFKTSAFVCPGANATHSVYNSTLDRCVASTFNGTSLVNTSAINNIGTGINTSVTGVGTPITYITIIILVIVFVAILVMLVKKLRDRT